MFLSVEASFKPHFDIFNVVRMKEQIMMTQGATICLREILTQKETKELHRTDFRPALI